MDATTLLVMVLALATGLALGMLIGSGLLRRQHLSVTDQLGAATTATAHVVAPVRDSLNRFDARLRELEASRVE